MIIDQLFCAVHLWKNLIVTSIYFSQATSILPKWYARWR